MSATHAPFSSDEAHKLITYNPETGVLMWKPRPGKNAWNARFADRIAGSTVSGYVCVTYGKIQLKAHRLAWLLMTERWPSKDIDHIDGDPLNNRWSNLREASESQNLANSKVPATNTSGWKGVHSRDRHKKWVATICVKQVKKHLGHFDCPAAASFAYQIAANHYFGDYARKP